MSRNTMWRFERVEGRLWGYRARFVLVVQEGRWFWSVEPDMHESANGYAKSRVAAWRAAETAAAALRRKGVKP